MARVHGPRVSETIDRAEADEVQHDEITSKWMLPKRLRAAPMLGQLTNRGKTMGPAYNLYGTTFLWPETPETVLVRETKGAATEVWGFYVWMCAPSICAEGVFGVQFFAYSRDSGDVTVAAGKMSKYLYV